MRRSSDARLAQDFVQSVEDAGELFFRGPGQPRADAIDRERADLADLDPRSLRQACRLALQRHGKSRSGFLTRQGYRDDCSGSIVKHIMAENEDRTPACLLV